MIIDCSNPKCDRKLRLKVEEKDYGAVRKAKCPTCGAITETTIEKIDEPTEGTSSPLTHFFKREDLSDEIDLLMHEIRDRIEADPVIKRNMAVLRERGYAPAHMLALFSLDDMEGQNNINEELQRLMRSKHSDTVH